MGLTDAHTRWIDERKPQIWSTPYSSQTPSGYLFFAFTRLQLFWFVLIGDSLERNSNSDGYIVWRPRCGLCVREGASQAAQTQE